MLSYLLFVVSLVSSSGFVNQGQKEEPMAGGMSGETTGGLIVKMGPVMNLRVADVRVIDHIGAGSELPAIAQKGSLFEGFSHSRLYAIRYGK